MLTFKIIAQSPSQAIGMMMALLPGKRIIDVRVDREYEISGSDVYNIKIEVDYDL